MKLRSAVANNHKREFLVITRAGREYSFPYVQAAPVPSSADPLSDVQVDKELGNEAFTFMLQSGNQGTVHFEQVLEYNEDPQYLADLLAYQLSLEARRCLDASELSTRQIARRLNTSAPQLYRLIDPSNTRKSMKQLVALLHVLGCEVDLVVRKKDAA